MMAANELWERALIPSLLSGSGTWFGLKGNTKVIDMCDDVQNFSGELCLLCLSLALRLPSGVRLPQWVCNGVSGQRKLCY